jgi:hypothetical protein
MDGRTQPKKGRHVRHKYPPDNHRLTFEERRIIDTFTWLMRGKMRKSLPEMKQLILWLNRVARPGYTWNHDRARSAVNRARARNRQAVAKGMKLMQQETEEVAATPTESSVFEAWGEPSDVERDGSWNPSHDEYSVW